MVLAAVLTAQHPARSSHPALASAHRAPGHVPAAGVTPVGPGVLQQPVPGRRGDHADRGIPADLGQERRLQTGGEHADGTLQHQAAQRPGPPGLGGKNPRGCGPGAHGRGHRGTTASARGLGTRSTASRSRAGSGCTYTCDDATEPWPSRSAITSMPPPASATFEPKACLS